MLEFRELRAAYDGVETLHGVSAHLAPGKLTAINRWLEEKIWKYGCMKDPVALFESVCGPFRPEEYVAYLEKKFTEIYEL